VLDVLDLHAFGPPHEERAGVRRVDEVGNLDAELTRLRESVLGRVNEDAEVVQERPLRVHGLASVELDVRAAGLAARDAGVARLRRLKAEGNVLLGGRVGLPRVERNVIEVVVDANRCFDEPDPQTVPELGVDDVRIDAVQIADAERDMPEHSWLAGAVGGETRELPAARVGADEREGVGPLDDVHPEPTGQGLGDPVPVGGPESHVIERLDLHGSSIPGAGMAAGGWKHGVSGDHGSVAADGVRVLVVAARQPGFAELLKEAGFAVDLHTRPVDAVDSAEADVAVVFRGRLIGRNQAAALAERGIPVVEVLTVEPPGRSTAGWLRLSNRVTKSDLVQIVQAVAAWTRAGSAVPLGAPERSEEARTALT
jgi:hypothetical protein